MNESDGDAPAGAADRLDLAERAARAGGAVAAGFFRREVAAETKEGKTDVVTRADRAAQRQVAAAIRTDRPDAVIVGEERVAGEGNAQAGPRAVPDAGPAWIVDPIDGTNNYVRGVPNWVTSVAAVVDGEAVAAVNVLPMHNDVHTVDGEDTYLNGDPVGVSDATDPEAMLVSPTLWWNRDRRAEYTVACRETVERFGDLRRVGSAQATLSMVATGGLDGAFTNVVAHPWDTVAGVLMIERAGGTVTDLAGEPWRHDAEGLVASNGQAHDELLAAARAVDRAA